MVNGDMFTDMLAAAAKLSDPDLLSRLHALAGRERHAIAELVAHLAEFDRRQLHREQGYGSLFSYCTEALRLSEHATFSRIAAARACRSFPVILDRLAEGAVNLSIVRLLAPHLTGDNHESLLEEARGRSKREVEVMVARLDLLRREIPDGDPGAIFDRALTLLLEDVARKKLAATTSPRPSRGADPRARLVPAEVKRTVWLRDHGQCAFVSLAGRRCRERTFLEFHHVEAYGRGGETTAANLSLRCREHNVYEAELLFGPWGPGAIHEPRAVYPA